MQTLLFGRKVHRAFDELALGFLGTVLLGSLACRLLDAPGALLVAAMLVYLAMAVLLAWWLPWGSRLGAANRVTLARGVLVCLLAAALAAPSWLESHAHWLVGMATLALVGDGFDGWVARRTGTESAFGARFDMELDAFLILVLCFCVIAVGKAGAWVLAIGAMRYLLVTAMQPWPWLAGPLPESLRRKTVCVWQVASLLFALSPWVPGHLAKLLLVPSLVLLAWSFAVDIGWLHRAERARAASPLAVAAEAPIITRTEPDHDR